MDDADITIGNYLLEEYKLPKVDILKIGHHSLRYSNSDELLDQIKSDLALMSAGVNN